MTALMSFFKNEALLRLGVLAVGLVLMYDALWANNDSETPPQPTPTIIVTETAVPTPNPTDVGIPEYTCSEWDAANSTSGIRKIFICYNTSIR